MRVRSSFFYLRKVVCLWISILLLCLSNTFGQSYNPVGAIDTIKFQDSIRIILVHDPGGRLIDKYTINPCDTRAQPTISSSKGAAICQGDSTVLIAPTSLQYRWSTGDTTKSIKVKQSGSYFVTITGTLHCVQTSLPFNFQVNPLPTASVITNSTICSGTSISIGASVVNGSTYSWSSSPPGFSSSSANPSVELDTTTTYTLTETDSNGCSKSNSVTITVNGIKAATVGSQTVCAGSDAVFTVVPTSSGPAPLSYQWQLSTNGGSTYTAISGATSSTYTVNSSSSSYDNYLYKCIITSGSCTPFTSTAGTLRVNAITSATVASQTVCAGKDAVFTVSTTSTGPASLAYQWKRSTDGGSSFSNISGATVSSYTVSAPTNTSDNYQYECIVTSTGCASFTSSAGALRVNKVTSAAVSGQTVCSGIDATFSVSTTNTGPSALTYQWQLSTNGGSSFSNISSATASTYTVSAPTNTSDNYQYECIVTSSGCASLTSTAGTLRVNKVTSTTVASQTVCSGTDATFSVSTTNTGPAALTYQWTQSNDGGSSFSNISSATSSSFTVSTPGSSSDNYQYECVVTSTGCTSLTSSAGTLRVNKVTSATVASQTVCSGTDATFSVSTANTGTAALSYQWQLSTNSGSSFSNISGANLSSYTVISPGSSSDNYQYECVVTSNGCASLTSSAGTLRVNKVTSASVAEQTVCSGTDATFSVITTNTGTAALTYQWQVSTNGGSSFNSISGAAGSSYTVTSPGSSSDNYQYECVVTSSGCASLTSSAGTLRINKVTSATVASQTVCSGTNAIFSVSTANTGPASLTYQWQLSTNRGSSFSNISGATSPSYTVSSPGSSLDNYQYECIVTSTGCASLTSSAGNLRVNMVTSATVAGQTVCAGSDATFSVSVSNSGSGSLTYQWKRSTNGGSTFSNISGATVSSYSETAPTPSYDNYQYECVVTSGGCAPYTSTVGTLRVNSVTAASVSNQTVCSGTNATFSIVSSSTGSSSLTYQWQVSTNGGTSFNNITSATSSTYTVTSPGDESDNYEYRCNVSSASCAAFSSTAGILRVNGVTTATVSDQVVCSGTDAVFTVYLTKTGTASLTYQWKRSTDYGSTFSDISGATTASYTVSAPDWHSDDFEYECIVTSGSCTPYTSTTGFLRVNSILAVNVYIGGTAVCAGSQASSFVSLSASGSSTLTYQWQISTNGGNTFGNISGETKSYYSISSADPSMDNNQYRLLVSPGSCP